MLCWVPDWYYGDLLKLEMMKNEWHYILAMYDGDGFNNVNSGREKIVRLNVSYFVNFSDTKIKI